MIYIKKFIDKVSLVESKQNKDLVIPMIDARGLRDELAKLLADMYQDKKNESNDVLQVEVKAGSFK